MRNYLFLLAIFIAVQVHSQTTFQKIYKNANATELGTAYCITSDGNYLVGGHEIAGVNEIAWVMKLNPLGNVLWRKDYPGLDQIYSICQTTDGGYAISGSCDSLVQGNLDVFILKTDSTGTGQWCKIFDILDYDYSSELIQDQDGGFLLTGGGFDNLFSVGNGFIIKTDSTGNLIWNNLISAAGSFWDHISNVKILSNGNRIVTGTYVENNEYRLLLWMIDSSGQTKWSRSYGSNLRGYITYPTIDGGFISSGYGTSPGIQNGYVLLKSDSLGELQWCKVYSDATGPPDLVLNTDGDFVMAGTYESSNDSASIYLIKTNPQGDTLWTRFYELDSQLDYHGESTVRIIQTTDGGYLVGGKADEYYSQYSDIYLLKLDSYGLAGCNLVHRPITIESITPSVDTSITVSSGIITSSIIPVNSVSQITDSTLCFFDRINEYENIISLDVFPNPATDHILINTSAFSGSEYYLEVKDMMGRTVINQKVADGNEVDVDVSILAKGIYVVILSGKKEVGKRVFCKH